MSFSNGLWLALDTNCLRYFFCFSSWPRTLILSVRYRKIVHANKLILVCVQIVKGCISTIDMYVRTYALSSFACWVFPIFVFFLAAAATYVRTHCHPFKIIWPDPTRPESNRLDPTRTDSTCLEPICFCDLPLHAGCFRFSYFLRCSCNCSCSCAFNVPAIWSWLVQLTCYHLLHSCAPCLAFVSFWIHLPLINARYQLLSFWIELVQLPLLHRLLYHTYVRTHFHPFSFSELTWKAGLSQFS